MPALDPTTLDVTPQQTADALADGSAVVIDVREPAEWDAGRIDGAVHIALGELSARAAELPTDRPVIFQCRVGSRSTMAAQAFRASGVDAYSLDGGLIAWVDAGLPLTPEGGSVASH